MEKEFILKIPPQLHNKMLEPTEYVMKEMAYLDTFQPSNPFIHEAAFFQGIQLFQPWAQQNVKICVEKIMAEWQQLKLDIQRSITEQNKKETQQIMKKGIAYFLESLYWTNELPVSFEAGIISKEIKIKPINVEERMAFIVSRLTGYHSFKQLDELFKELQKQFAVKMSKRKS
ncbi:MAG: YpoC family protein [Bacillus sp. (in: firmicutes)]